MLKNISAILLVTLFTFVAWANPKVLMVTPEQSHIFQTGGLAHASTGLAEGLNHENIKTDVLMPYFLEMNTKTIQEGNRKFSVELDWRNGESHKTSDFTLHRNTGEPYTTFFLRHEANVEINYFNNNRYGKSKKFYGPESISGESFAAFAKAAADFILSSNYDIVILNDWTTGLIATHLKDAKERNQKVPKVIFAIHNIEYQGVYPKSLSNFLGLTERHYNIQGFEYWGKMSFIKAGLKHSDMIYTVSPQYAEEVTTPRFGAGLNGIAFEKKAQNRVIGIMNGINNEEWDPSIKRKNLEETFSVSDMSGKEKGKLALQKDVGFEINTKIPLSVLTSRLAEQKGLDWLIDAVWMAAEQINSQWIIIGNGDEIYVNKLKELEKKHPSKVRYMDFSEAMEKRLIRYADFFVNGARFEPMGLNQMFALRNATLPIVSRVGGLLNSVKQDQTGLLFDIVYKQTSNDVDKDATRESAFTAIKSAVRLFENKSKMDEMRKQAMLENNSWIARVQNEFRPFFDFVLNSGYDKMSFSQWKESKSVERSCKILISR